MINDIQEIKRKALAYADAKDAKRGGVAGEGTAMLREHIALIEDLERQLAEAHQHLEHAYSFMTIEVSGKMELYDPHCDECAAVKGYVDAAIAAAPSPSQSHRPKP